MTSNNRSLRNAQVSITHRCVNCESPDKVDWYCNECMLTLCDQCKESHTRKKEYKYHDILEIGKANRQDNKPVLDGCKQHPGKPCDLFCSDCNELHCTICVSKSHKLHNWKPIEEEFTSKKQQLKGHITTISSKIQHVQNESSKINRVNEDSKQNIETMKKRVNSQRTKLKSEIDSIADAVIDELSLLERQDSAAHDDYCLRSHENVNELTRLLEKAELAYKSGEALFETEKSLNATLPLYDVNVNAVLPKQLSFVTGRTDRRVMKTMLGELFQDNRDVEKDLSVNHLQRLSMFKVRENDEILSIYPVEDNQAWLSINRLKGLLLVNMEGRLTDTAELDFCPYRVTMLGTTDLLLTSSHDVTFVYKLSLHNKHVTKFADIRPHQVCDISTNERGEVFVSTRTQVIVVLNSSGKIVRELTCEMNAWNIACICSGVMAVVDITNTLFFIDSSGKTKFEWTCELANGQRLDDTDLYQMSRDRYGRLYVPDSLNNQVFVLSQNSFKVMCLLERKYKITHPIAVGLDTSGRVWIGCMNGTVHIMEV